MERDFIKIKTSKKKKKIRRFDLSRIFSLVFNLFKMCFEETTYQEKWKERIENTKMAKFKDSGIKG